VTRAILDTNLLISYLLDPTSDGPPAQVVRGAITSAFVLLVSPQLLRELCRKVTSKPYLVERIPDSRLTSFVQRLPTFADLHDDTEILYPPITRDRKGDYLVTNAVAFGADFLVSGDRDLLHLGGEFEGVRIVSPAEFSEFLERHASGESRIQ
jgi:putative PIN family toxin of toxin-antitoxin system